MLKHVTYSKNFIDISHQIPSKQIHSKQIHISFLSSVLLPPSPPSFLLLPWSSCSLLCHQCCVSPDTTMPQQREANLSSITRSGLWIRHMFPFFLIGFVCSCLFTRSISIYSGLSPWVFGAIKAERAVCVFACVICLSICCPPCFSYSASNVYILKIVLTFIFWAVCHAYTYWMIHLAEPYFVKCYVPPKSPTIGPSHGGHVNSGLTNNIIAASHLAVPLPEGYCTKPR